MGGHYSATTMEVARRHLRSLEGRGRPRFSLVARALALLEGVEDVARGRLGSSPVRMPGRATAPDADGGPATSG